MNAIHTGTTEVTPEQLAALDLNLVVAFDALARERSVTAAAARVGVTQSAMSHALRRLREQLGDPLLVRGRRGMLLTPRAEALVVPLRSGLVTLGRALTQPTGFDPRTARRAFRIVSPDLFDVVAIPVLLERIRNEAPGIDISIVPRDQRSLADQLETGELDAAVVPRMDSKTAPAQPDSGLRRVVLFRDSWICLIRADHPALSPQPRAAGSAGRRKRAAPQEPAALSLESFAALSHLSVAPRGEGTNFIDELLAQRGLTRRVMLKIPHFYSALGIVAKSDLILTAPSTLARFAPPTGAVVALPAPIELPGHSLNLLWHERFSNDPGHSWLREIVSDSARRAVTPAPPAPAPVAAAARPARARRARC